MKAPPACPMDGRGCFLIRSLLFAGLIIGATEVSPCADRSTTDRGEGLTAGATVPGMTQPPMIPDEPAIGVATKKRSRSIAIVAIAAIVLALCLGGGVLLAAGGKDSADKPVGVETSRPAAPAATTAVTAAPTGPPQTAIDDFLAAAAPLMEDLDDETLLGLGTAQCNALERTDGDVKTVATVDTEVPASTLLSLLGAAVTHLCPAYTAQLAAYKKTVKPTIDDGTWTVGVDFPAGQYRVIKPVGTDCYWAIVKSGTNGDDIISNDIPRGGRPTVTLKKGQDFETARCGTWAKLG